MTSQERHEARFQRRKAKRLERKQARCDSLGPMNKVFSYRKMFFYGKKCCNGVRWKQSVQNFEGHLFSGTATRRRMVLEQTWKPKSCSHFTLRERGKIRLIDAPHITDRQIHKTLCNEVLIPLYSPSMIYDNRASQRGKGLHWQFKRIKQQLGWHYRRYGREGAVLLLDLKGFFPNASHALLYQRHRELILNPELQNLADTIIQFPHARHRAGACLWVWSLPNRKWWPCPARLTNGSSVRPMFIAPVITWMITMLSLPRWMKQS